MIGIQVRKPRAISRIDDGNDSAFAGESSGMQLVDASARIVQQIGVRDETTQIPAEHDAEIVRLDFDFDRDHRTDLRSIGAACIHWTR